MVSTYELDCGRLRTREEAHAYLAQELALPAHYGGNLDALYDCLTEPAERTILLTGADALRREGGYGAKLLQTLEDAARDCPSLTLHYALSPAGTGGYSVRFASEADAEALLAIYAQYIHTAITFETALPTREAFAGRIRDISQLYPYLVLERDGRAVGYAYAHRARERAAYDWYLELSIYLDGAVRGRGLGRKLYGLLLELLRLQGAKTAMGCVTLPNPASQALHAGLGFRLAGVSEKAGYKNGAWHDVAWYEKPLAAYDTPPAPVTPIRETDAAARAALLDAVRWE